MKTCNLHHHDNPAEQWNNFVYKHRQQTEKLSLKNCGKLQFNLIKLWLKLMLESQASNVISGHLLTLVKSHKMDIQAGKLTILCTLIWSQPQYIPWDSFLSKSASIYTDWLLCHLL